METCLKISAKKNNVQLPPINNFKWGGLDGSMVCCSHGKLNVGNIIYPVSSIRIDSYPQMTFRGLNGYFGHSISLQVENNLVQDINFNYMEKLPGDGKPLFERHQHQEVHSYILSTK